MDERQAHDTVRTLVAEDLNGRFGDEFVFDPILVETREGYDGDEYFHLNIIFDGDQQRLDPHWTGGLVTRVLPRLQEQGIDTWPSPHFIEKSEWDAYVREMNRRKRAVALLD